MLIDKKEVGNLVGSYFSNLAEAYFKNEPAVVIDLSGKIEDRVKDITGKSFDTEVITGIYLEQARTRLGSYWRIDTDRFAVASKIAFEKARQKILSEPGEEDKIALVREAIDYRKRFNERKDKIIDEIAVYDVSPDSISTAIKNEYAKRDAYLNEFGDLLSSEKGFDLLEYCLKKDDPQGREEAMRHRLDYLLADVIAETLRPTLVEFTADNFFGKPIARKVRDRIKSGIRGKKIDLPSFPY